MPYLERGSSMGNSGQRYIETPDYSHSDKQAWSVSFFFPYLPAFETESLPSGFAPIPLSESLFCDILILYQILEKRTSHSSPTYEPNGS